MATTDRLEGTEEGEHKIVREYIPVQIMLKELFDEANHAEVGRETYPSYLTRIFDELSEIARVKCGADEQSFDSLMVDWEDLDEVYGDLDDRRGRLKMKEWRERKGSLIRLRERLGMGTSPPTQGRDLSRPLRMADYHRFCTISCTRKKEIMESRKRWQ